MVSFVEIELAALSLSPDERIQLANRLIESIPDEPIQEPLGATDDELGRRLDTVVSGDYQAVPWREAVTQLRDALSRVQG